MNIMENESFERAKAIKEEIEECNSLLESILKSSRECCVYRDADRGTRDLVVIPPSQSIVPSTLLMDFT